MNINFFSDANNLKSDVKKIATTDLEKLQYSLIRTYLLTKIYKLHNCTYDVVLRRIRVASLTPRNLTGSSSVQVYLFLCLNDLDVESRSARLIT